MTSSTYQSFWTSLVQSQGPYYRETLLQNLSLTVQSETKTIYLTLPNWPDYRLSKIRGHFELLWFRIRLSKIGFMSEWAKTCMTQHLNLVPSSIWTIFLLPLLICTEKRTRDAWLMLVFFAGTFTQTQSVHRHSPLDGRAWKNCEITIHPRTSNTQGS